MSNSQTLNKTNSPDFLIQYSNGLTSFSTSVNDNKNMSNIYTAHTSGDSLYLNNYSLANNQLESSNSTNYSLSQLLGNFGSVLSLNYFISNNSRFVTLGTYLNQNYNITILSLNTNKSISFQSDAAYSLSLINRFQNSPDVYFSLYNYYSFFIVKYSFSTNNFTIFYNFKYTNAVNINGFYKDNKIYFSFSTFFDSYILVLNYKGLIYDQSFSYMHIQTFTATNDGFLISDTDGTLFYYISNTYDLGVVANQTQNLKVLRPFDNNTFVEISTNYLDIVTINGTGKTISLRPEYNYTINYQNNANLEYLFKTLDINGMKYIIYQSQNYGSGETYIAINHIYNAPTNYNGPILTTTTTNPLTSQNQVQIQSTSSTYTIYTSSKNNPSIFYILLGLVLLVAGFVAFVLIVISRKKDNNNLRNENRYDRTPNRSTNNPPNIPDNPSYTNQSSMILQKNSFCAFCGSPFSGNDIFCPKCGKRI